MTPRKRKKRAARSRYAHRPPDDQQGELLPELTGAPERGEERPGEQRPEPVEHGSSPVVGEGGGAVSVEIVAPRDVESESGAAAPRPAVASGGPPSRPAAGSGGTSAAATGATGALTPAGDAAGPPKPAGDTAGAPKPAGDRLARARDLVEHERVEEAIALYGEILRDNPASLKAHNNLGVLFDELGKHETAVQHFEEALRVDPENVEVLTNHAGALTALGRFDEAAAMLRRALRLAPDDIQARLGTGVLSFRRGLYEQAETELGWVCDQDARSGPAFYYRGEALNRIGRFDEAVEPLERASELLPADPRPFYTLGHLYDRRSLPAEAAEMYRRARDLQKS
jgi:Flp pilus assembly protein TadD